MFGLHPFFPSFSLSVFNAYFNRIYNNTLTSYYPDSDGKSDGKTGSDVERILSFNEVGLEDPGRYTKPWEELVKYALECEKQMKSKG